MGKFKPRASKKKNKRTVHFALVVFKSAESVEKLLADSKFLQSKVNKAAAKTIGFGMNPFLKHTDCRDVNESESELSEEEVARRENKVKMESDGFTMVEADSFKPTRIRARDAYTNSIQGVSAEKAKEMMEKRKKVNEEEFTSTYTTQKEKRAGVK